MIANDPTISDQHETVKIPKTKVTCPACEEYALAAAAKPVVVMCCEGGCARGEIARRAANLLCFELAPQQTARLCLGAAFTKDSGQRNLARRAQRLLAIEGCFIKCASRMMVGVLPEIAPEIIVADDLYDLDPIPFSINEVSEMDANHCARQAAEKIAAAL